MYTLNDPPRMNPTVVIPKSSAKLKANSVGADFDRTISQPILATFSKISEEIRPLKTMILSRQRYRSLDSAHKFYLMHYGVLYPYGITAIDQVRIKLQCEPRRYVGTYLLVLPFDSSRKIFVRV